MARLITVILIFTFYLWTATNGKFIFNLSIKELDYFQLKYNYNFLVKSLLSGHLHLDLDIPKELLNSSNPYDPTLNKIARTNYGLQELSLYKSMFYLYTGVTPVISMYIPYHLMTSRYLPDNLVIFIYMFGAFIFSVLILIHLKNSFFGKTPEWMVILAIFSIGFLNMGPFLLRRPQTYEVAVSSACFFLMGAIYFICTLLKHKKISFISLCAISIFIGLSIGSRAYFIISGFSILLAVLFKMIKDNETSIIKYLALLIPYSLICILITTYNYFRFNSFLEFGYKYVISLGDVRTFKIFDINNLSSNLYYYLFAKPFIKEDFPFLFMNNWTWKWTNIEYSERIVGIIPSCPFILLLIISPALFKILQLINKTKHKHTQSKFPLFEFIVITLPALINFCLLLSCHYICTRYTTDFMTYLILLTIIIWFFYYEKLLLSKSKFIYLLNFVSILLILWSITLSVLFSITGPSYTFENHMSQIKRYEKIYMPIKNFVKYYLKNKVPSL